MWRFWQTGINKFRWFDKILASRLKHLIAPRNILSEDLMKTFKVCIRLLLIAVTILFVFSVVAESQFAMADVPDAHADADAAGDMKEKGDPGLLTNLMTLAMLVLLQAVLGFDNLLYISLESKHAPVEKRQFVRSWGIGIAIFLRIALLCFLVYLKDWFEETKVFTVPFTDYFEADFNLHSLIVLAGGAFIIYTAMKEIWHMTRLEHDDHDGGKGKSKSVSAVIFWIVVMNIVFSFDSILSAMALSDVFWVMAAAIVISGVAMVWLSDHVATFLEKNRMYEVLGLFVLFIVGIMLISEGGHHAHLKLMGDPVMPMTKTTFYFVLGVLVLTDIVQGRYQKKLLAAKNKAHA